MSNLVRDIKKEISNLTDPETKNLLNDGIAYEGLILKGVSEVSTEKNRTDGKTSRQYYTARFSQGLFGKTFSKTFFQDYNSNNKPEWRNSPDPNTIASAVGTSADGVVAYSVRLNKKYEINNQGRTTTTDNLSFTVMPGENFGTILRQQLVAKKLIAPAASNVVESATIS